MRRQHGFTLIELMVVLAVTGIMLGFGVPKITRMLQGNRVVASLNNLSAHLIYARSEAVRRSTSVSVVALDPDPTLWERGWMVFVDPNADGVLDPGEQQLRVVDALNIPNFTIRPTNNIVTFNRLGTAPQNGFTLTESTDSEHIIEKKINISPTGHVNIP